MRDITIELPHWLDEYLFNKEHAIYDRQFNFFLSQKWTQKELATYLGTYFPRSYAEAKHIAEQYIQYSKSTFANRETIRVLDVFAGTGGQVFGLLDSIVENLPNVTNVDLCYVDANAESYCIFRRILDNWIEKYDQRIRVSHRALILDVESTQDWTICAEWAKLKHERFDVVLSFKGLCELTRKSAFGKLNPYALFVEQYFPLLDPEGVMIIEDVMLKLSEQDGGRWTVDLVCEAISQAKKWQWLLARKQDFEPTVKVKHSGINGEGDSESIDWYMIKGQQMIPDEKVSFSNDNCALKGVR